ncbi:hypothetical protein AB4Y88_14615 [Paenarthrobacter sp. RAF9]
MTVQTHTPADVPAKNAAATTPAGAPDKGKDGRGATTVADGVVAKIAGIAIQEIPGVHALGGGAARAVTEVNITITDIHVPSEDADADDAGREPRVA